MIFFLNHKSSFLNLFSFMQIYELIKKYGSKINVFDLELLITHALGKTREFVLTHPEYSVNSRQNSIINKNIRRRTEGEPIAYIVGHKEFYGLDFIVNKNTLIPRPETEQIVDLAIKEISNLKFQISNLSVVDIGTGSGNIMVSTVYNIQHSADSKNIKYFATDISKEALQVAKKNAKKHAVDKKINFLHGSLLEPLLKANKLTKLKTNKLLITANLPYLSKEIYASAQVDVKKYEPKSALYSPKKGLGHYEKLLSQIKKILITVRLPLVTCLLEISPEQKQLLTKLIKKLLPSAKIYFFKDLAGKWRICKIVLK